ncbi:hypothetical protein HGRIS_014872 [Hohenbuehelia grisea]|uniref:Uncharacterized protein n=1 Tax=Hohenbuehelia grisea TaxID=104357 RepID=A0ABR3IR00_9AGAR
MEGEDRVERVQEECCRMRLCPGWDDSMEVDEDLNTAVVDESEDDNDDDSDIVKGPRLHAIKIIGKDHAKFSLAGMRFS